MKAVALIDEAGPLVVAETSLGARCVPALSDLASGFRRRRT
jgi:hypothetical protein